MTNCFGRFDSEISNLKKIHAIVYGPLVIDLETNKPMKEGIKFLGLRCPKCSLLCRNLVELKQHLMEKHSTDITTMDSLKNENDYLVNVIVQKEIDEWYMLLECVNCKKCSMFQKFEM